MSALIDIKDGSLKVARHTGLLCLNIIAALSYLMSWLLFLAALLTLSLAPNDLINSAKYAGLCVITFAIAIPLRRFTRRMQKKDLEVRRRSVAYGRWAVLILATAFVLFIKFTFFPTDLRHLAAERRAVITQQLRPAVTRYRQEQGHYPRVLSDLIPGYLPILPPALDNTRFPKRAYQISYFIARNKDSAGIRYRDCLGPDCGASIDLKTGKYVHDM